MSSKQNKYFWWRHLQYRYNEKFLWGKTVELITIKITSILVKFLQLVGQNVELWGRLLGLYSPSSKIQHNKKYILYNMVVNYNMVGCKSFQITVNDLSWMVFNIYI